MLCVVRLCDSPFVHDISNLRVATDGAETAGISEPVQIVQQEPGNSKGTVCLAKHSCLDSRCTTSCSWR